MKIQKFNQHLIYGVLGIALALLSLLPVSGIAQTAERLNSALPAAYVPPAKPVTGTIRIWGHGAYDNKNQDFIESLAKIWEAGFQKYHPDVHFENKLLGTAAAIGALYTGVGDFALMGREIWPNEISAFKEVFGYAPTGLDVVTGSFDVRNRGYALVVFVHKDNPLNGLSLQQLEAAFGADNRPGAQHATTWGDLGASGQWKDKPIHLYGLPISRGFGQFFEDAVFEGRRKWNPSLREFADQAGSRGGATDGGQMMLDAMAKDPLALGYAGLLYSHPDVKPLALSARQGAPLIAPTKENVINHSYPLTRKITMFFNRVPGQPVDPKLAEFLRYILSRDAQQAIVQDGGGYLPIIEPFATQELKKLH